MIKTERTCDAEMMNGPCGNSAEEVSVCIGVHTDAAGSPEKNYASADLCPRHIRVRFIQLCHAVIRLDPRNADLVQDFLVHGEPYVDGELRMLNLYPREEES